MKQVASWAWLGRALHRLSALKIVFYALGFYYQLVTFLGSREAFTRNLCTSLFMYGLAMVFEGLRDNQLVAQRRHARPQLSVGAHQAIIAVAAVLFTGAVGLGLFFLFLAHDTFQGQAILTFGIGGLALLRQEYDCLGHALSLRGEPPTAGPERVAAKSN